MPAPPAPLMPPAGTPDEQAAALAAATEPGTDNVLAGWLAAYELARIPVLQENSPVGSTGDDPIGPQFWRVWLASSLTAANGSFRLVDFVRLLGPNETQAAEVATALVDDLEHAAEGDEPELRLMARFLLDKMSRPTGRSLDGAAIDQVRIDGATAEFLHWMALRAELAAVASDQLAADDALPARQPVVLAAVALAADPPCSTKFGSEDADFWVSWLVTTLSSGTEVHGAKLLPGLVDVLERLEILKPSTAEVARGRLGKAAVAAALMTLLMQLYAVEVAAIMEPEPLERTRSSTSDGKDGTIVWRLSVNPKLLPDGEGAIACAASFLLSAFGISFKFPGEKRISGAEMTFEGRVGFGDYVLFGNEKQRPLVRLDTDTNGEAAIPVQGKAQPKEVPNSAELTCCKEFSIAVSAQPESVDGNTMFSIFFSGLTSGLNPSATGAATALIDLSKTFHWDMGEFVFRLADYESGPPAALAGSGTIRHRGNWMAGGNDMDVTISGLEFEHSETFSRQEAYKAVAGQITVHIEWNSNAMFTNCRNVFDGIASLPGDIVPVHASGDPWDKWPLWINPVASPGFEAFGFSFVKLHGTPVMGCPVGVGPIIVPGLDENGVYAWFSGSDFEFDPATWNLTKTGHSEVHDESWTLTPAD